MAPRKPATIKRRIIRTVDAGNDLQIHVSVLSVDTHRVIDVRNFIVSTKKYGRGLVIPLAQGASVRDALTAIIDSEPR